MFGNAVSSETALIIFLIFCMKLGDYWGRKVTESNFPKKILIWRFLRKGLQISSKSDPLIFFSKMALTIFLVFGLKLVLNVSFILNETHFLILLNWKKWKQNKWIWRFLAVSQVVVSLLLSVVCEIFLQAVYSKLDDIFEIH